MTSFPTFTCFMHGDACGRVGWEAKIHTKKASKDEPHAAITQRKLEKLLECPICLNCTMNTSAAIEQPQSLLVASNTCNNTQNTTNRTHLCLAAHGCSASCAHQKIFCDCLRASSDQPGRHPSTTSLSRSASRIALKQAADKSTSSAR